MQKEVLVCFYLEACMLYYQSYNWHLGEEAFKNAIEQTNLNYELTGVFGKRTKFQQTDIPQLILRICKGDKDTSEDFIYSNSSMDKSSLPKVKSLEFFKLRD